MENKKKMPPPTFALPSRKPSENERSANVPHLQLQMEVLKDGALIQSIPMKKEVSCMGFHCSITRLHLFSGSSSGDGVMGWLCTVAELCVWLNS